MNASKVDRVSGTAPPHADPVLDGRSEILFAVSRAAQDKEARNHDNFEFHLNNRKLGYLNAGQICRLIKPGKETIEGFFPSDGVVIVNGKNGIGKTYFVIDLALSIACGFDFFHGRRLLRSSKRVVVLGWEGKHTYPSRITAWCKHHDIEIPLDRFHFKYVERSLADPKDRDQLDEEIKALNPDVVIIDTLGAATVGLDEDKAKEMGPIIDWCRKVSVAVDGLVMLVTHPPKGNLSTTRGSNVIESNADAVVQVKKKGNGILILAQKIRTSSPGPPIELRFKEVDLGPDPERPKRRIKSSVLTSAQPQAKPIELVLDELTSDADCITVASLVGELVAREVCSKTAAYRSIDRLLPLGEQVLILNKSYTREGRKITVSSEAFLEISQ
ncbi:MAG: AAA family ATPase [Pseudomonadota bacterium]